jgi:hypothetical protein
VSDTDTGVRQSITVEGSDIKGDITNDAASKKDSTRGAVDQSITVEDSIVDGKLRNRAGPQRVEAESLVETAITQLKSERADLEQKASTLDTDDLLTQLLARTNDGSAAETLRGIVEQRGEVTGDETNTYDHSSPPAPNPIPTVQAISALTEVERLTASEDPELESLYVAIEKVVRLLSELDAPISDELEAFVNRQRTLTEGSIYEETLDDPTRNTLQTLCDRAREAIMRSHISRERQ